MISIEGILRDFAVFSDLGTVPPRVVEVGDRHVLRMVRNGVEYSLNFGAEGDVILEVEGEQSKFRTHRSLLASEYFADLARWARNQEAILSDLIIPDAIEPAARISSGREDGYFEEISGFDGLDDLFDSRSETGATVYIIDGPAGVGKTKVIEQIARNRAKSFRERQAPLIFHVESRGRVLQNVLDLMAFSLQTLRVPVTFDQIPSLVRHGLVTLAIDGFDELADPNSYDLSWAQLNEIVEECSPRGVVILGGRDTFLSLHSVSRALTTIDVHGGELRGLSLQPATPSVAKSWLASKGWTDEQLNHDLLKPLFEPGSSALLPFFLDKLRDPHIVKQAEKVPVDDILTYLVISMVDREITKFGAPIEAVTTESVRRQFLNGLLAEIARDLADNQTDSISESNLAWLVDVESEGLLPREVVPRVKARVAALAFLGNSERRGFRRFSHEQFKNFFLSLASIPSVANGDVPKFVRRNILGADFLSVLSRVARLQSEGAIEGFVGQSVIAVDNVSSIDRSPQNLAAMCVAVVCGSGYSKPVVFKGLGFDEVFFSGLVPEIALEDCSISKLIASDADLLHVSLKGTSVVSVVANEGTEICLNFPVPSVLDLPGKHLNSRESIAGWISDKFERYDDALNQIALRDMRKLPLVSLLEKFVRYRPYWIKQDSDQISMKILTHERWPLLREILSRHGFLVEKKDLQTAGRGATFYHLKNKSELLLKDRYSGAAAEVYKEILKESAEDIRKLARLNSHR